MTLADPDPVAAPVPASAATGAAVAGHRPPLPPRRPPGRWRRLTDVAVRFGTPTYVLDECDVRLRCQKYVAEFGAGAVAYTAKALLRPLVHRESIADLLARDAG
jgi:hypothetical protein